MKKVNPMKRETITTKKYKAFIVKSGMPILLYLLIMAVLLFEFGSVSKVEAEEDVIQILKQNSAASLSLCIDVMNEVEASGKAIAESLRHEKKTEENLISYAAALQNSQSFTNKVIIADKNGHAYTSDGKIEDISKSSYFSKAGGIQYSFVESDHIIKGEAVVISVPYYNNVMREGSIYMSISVEMIKALFASLEVEGISAHVICDGEANYLISEGEESTFTKDKKFIENFENAEIKGSSYGRLPIQFASDQLFLYRAELDGQLNDFLTRPLGIRDWKYTAIIDNDYAEDLIASKIRSSRGIIIGILLSLLFFITYVIVIRIIEFIQNREQRNSLSELADTDLLTGLNNKAATQRKIQEYIDAHPDVQGVFFIFDIDDFKKINDTQGHAFGDEVLRNLGKQITNEFRMSDIIGRTGGDEFIIFLKGIQTNELVEMEARRLLKFFKNFQVGEYVKYSVTASIGATVYPRDAENYEELYKVADSALYEAKKRGKNRLVFYHKDMPEVSPEQKKDKTKDSDK